MPLFAELSCAGFGLLLDASSSLCCFTLFAAVLSVAGFARSLCGDSDCCVFFGDGGAGLLSKLAAEDLRFRLRFGAGEEACAGSPRRLDLDGECDNPDLVGESSRLALEGERLTPPTTGVKRLALHAEAWPSMESILSNSAV